MRIRQSLLVAALAVTALTVTPAAAIASSGVDTGHDRPDLGVTTTQPSLRILSMRSGLKVGTAVNMDLYGSNAKYTRVVDQQFNTVTAENVMKWQLVEPTQGTYDWAAADRLVAGARADHQLVRGHTLVWHNQLPELAVTDGTTTSFTPQQVRDLLRKHIVDEVTHFRGQIWQWDVVNEAFNDDGTPRQDIFYKAYQALGLDPLGYIADAFRWAHQADPHALLFYNDYRTFEFHRGEEHAVYSFVQQLRAQHVPVAGVGFQGHLDTQYGFPDLQNNLQRFAALGLKVALTEVDVRTFVQPDPANPGTFTDIPLTPPSAGRAGVLLEADPAGLPRRQAVHLLHGVGVGDANSWIPGVFTGEGAGLLFDDNLNPEAAVPGPAADPLGRPRRPGASAETPRPRGWVLRERSPGAPPARPAIRLLRARCPGDEVDAPARVQLPRAAALRADLGRTCRRHRRRAAEPRRAHHPGDRRALPARHRRARRGARRSDVGAGRQAEDARDTTVSGAPNPMFRPGSVAGSRTWANVDRAQHLIDIALARPDSAACEAQCGQGSVGDE